MLRFSYRLSSVGVMKINATNIEVFALLGRCGSVDWYLDTEVSGQLVGPIFKVKVFKNSA
jgi:hypothetical protein